MKNWEAKSKTIMYKKSAGGFDYVMNRSDLEGKLIALDLTVTKTPKEGVEDAGEVFMRGAYKKSEESALYPPVSISFQPSLSQAQVTEMISVFYEGM